MRPSRRRHPPAGIVLRSPFTELADVGAHHYPWMPVRALLRDRFPVVEHLATSDVPVTVIYGDRDSVVPTVLSARVADHAPSLAERVVIPGADHNDPVMFGPPVADAVARLAHAVAEGARHARWTGPHAGGLPRLMQRPCRRRMRKPIHEVRTTQATST